MNSIFVVTNIDLNNSVSDKEIVNFTKKRYILCRLELRILKNLK